MSIHGHGNKITLKHDMEACISEEAQTLGQKQLKRLPHVFCKFIDLPFAAETPILVEERTDCYAFITLQPGLQETDVVAEVVQIVPGATKVVLRGAERIKATLMRNNNSSSRNPNPNPEMRNWRLRLPACTAPEAASTSYAEGILTITIPKVVPREYPSAERGQRPRSGGAEMKCSVLCASC